MPIQVLMPALSPTMTEGNLIKWLKNEGDKIKAGEVIAEIETDKATMEVEAVDEGTLGKIVIPAGTDAVKVNSLIALILEDGEDVSAINIPVAAVQSQPMAKPETAPVEIKANIATPSTAPTQGTRVFASPLAKRIATQKGINLNQVQGSGPMVALSKAMWKTQGAL